MAEEEQPSVGLSAPRADGEHNYNGRSVRGRSDQQKNSLKTPLLEKVQARSRHVTREESKINHTWVYIMTFFAVMGNIALGYGLGYSSPVQVNMSEDLNLTVSQFSTFGSLITLGAMAGAVISGSTADYFGRKGGLVFCCIPSIVGFLLISFAQTHGRPPGTIPLYIGRFFTGVAGGVVCYIVPTLVSETAPRHLRGFLGTMQQFCVTVGILLAYIVGMFVNWRVLAATGTIPCIISLVGLVFVPESPHFLAMMGRTEDVENSLHKLRGPDYDISDELSEIQAGADHAKETPSAKITDLFQKKYARPLIAGCGVHILQQITGVNGVMLYSQAVFLAAGVANPNIASISLAATQVVMTFVSASLSDKAGRRLLLLVSTSGMSLSLFLLGFSFYLRGVTDEGGISSGLDVFIDILALSSLMVYIGSYALGLGPVPWVLLGEIFPNHVKAMAGSLASLVNWSSAFLITLTFNFLLLWSNSGAFWLFAVIGVFGVIFIASFLPETRGKTLEQIESSFS